MTSTELKVPRIVSPHRKLSKSSHQFYYLMSARPQKLRKLISPVPSFTRSVASICVKWKNCPQVKVDASSFANPETGPDRLRKN
jgi:hypothetical protein